ncbi:MAG: DNA mismatch repair protein MutS [Bacteroidia bacterium]|jgi:DNA mismatch repair protein MutS
MAKKTEDAETPLMQQYNQIKAKYPGAILLFRVGDFYETFGEDAIKAAGILGIVLTKRANGSASHIELAGFPHHALDTYLPKLVRAGQRVAICDQLEDPKLTKKIVKRGVTELVTPGVSFNDKILDHKQSNYLASVHFSEHQAGCSFLDISTGEFLVAQGNTEYIEKLIHGFNPSEIIVSKPVFKQYAERLFSRFYVFQLDDWVFQHAYTYEKLIRHFNTASLKGFGIQEMELAVIAAGACLHYLDETHHERKQHIQSVSRIDEHQYVWLDRFTIRNLELIVPANEFGKSLLQVIDQTVTPMGARMLKKWMVLPLRDKTLIEERHQVVEYALHNEKEAREITDLLKQCGDLERIVSKLAMRRISPRELQQLNRSIKLISPLKIILESSSIPEVTKLASRLNLCEWLMQQCDKLLVDEPPAFSNKGGIIREGINAELDELRSIAFSGKDYLLKIQQEEQQRTGISSLKVGYNGVFGYYLEVTNVHKEKVPPEWIRKQTLTNAERYITEELKHYEQKILGAEEKILSIEENLFNELVVSLSEFVNPVLQNAAALAQLDCLTGFARLATRWHYTKPQLNEEGKLLVKEARHPVIEQQLPEGEPYIANDIFLDQDKQQIVILTGPNMSGKSAVLRQTALIVILAQIGSYVPASYAEIGITDKVFTRVGASDNISGGESTFMVEMTETASILNNLSPKSLVLLDEIGRGTSTYDGVSLAWAIATFLNQHPCKPKTLFATHYHELNELEQQYPGIVNYHIQIQESGQKIIFLRKLVKGGSEHSFGIHVARMAGVPQLVLSKATEVLEELEKQRRGIGDGSEKIKPGIQTMQLSMFQLNDPLLERIRSELTMLDIDTLTPVESLMKLSELKKLLSG